MADTQQDRTGIAHVMGGRAPQPSPYSTDDVPLAAVALRIQPVLVEGRRVTAPALVQPFHVAADEVGQLGHGSYVVWRWAQAADGSRFRLILHTGRDALDVFHQHFPPAPKVDALDVLGYLGTAGPMPAAQRWVPLNGAPSGFTPIGGGA